MIVTLEDQKEKEKEREDSNGNPMNPHDQDQDQLLNHHVSMTANHADSSSCRTTDGDDSLGLLSEEQLGEADRAANQPEEW